MWWAVRRHLNDNSSIWNGIEPFTKASDMLSEAIERARAALDAQSGTTKGISKDRKLLKEDAIRKTGAIADSTMVYVMESGNGELLQAVEYSRSALMKMGHHKLASRLRTMVAAARSLGEALRIYGVVQDDCDRAMAAIVAMEEAQAYMRTVISGRKTVTMSIPLIMAAGQEALARMDHLLHLFEPGQPAFVTGYRNARTIHPFGIQHRSGPPAEAA